MLNRLISSAIDIFPYSYILQCTAVSYRAKELGGGDEDGSSGNGGPNDGEFLLIGRVTDV